jgi:hypothetical protein
MAYAEESSRLRGSINEQASSLAHERRRLTRAAKTGGVGVVDQVTVPGLFAQRIEQLQDGSRPLVLTSIPLR